MQARQGAAMNNMLIVVCGPPCSGKTTLAAAIASRTGFPHLEMDRIRESLIPGSDSREEHRDLGYRCMHLMAEQLMQAGVNLILDATYGRDVHRRAIGEMINSIGVTTFLVQCRAPVEVAVERFRARPAGHPAVDLTEERVRRLASEFVSSPEGIVVDTSQPLDTCLGEIRSAFPILFMPTERSALRDHQ